MAIKRWNANTSSWELVGTPGTVTPASIGSPSLAGGNIFSGTQTFQGFLGIDATGLTQGFRAASTNANERTISNFQNLGLNGSSFTIRAHGSNYSETLLSNSLSSNTLMLSESGSLMMGTYVTQPLIFGTNNTERMRINASGNVGIGRSPTAGLRLEINGGIYCLDTPGAETIFRSHPSVNFGELGTLNSVPMTFITSSTERMRILSTGGVVIGHTSALNNEAFGVRVGANIQNIWLDSTDPNYSTVVFGNRVTRANTSAYTFLQNWSGGGSDTEHYLRGDGQAYADGSWNGGGADYAEYFEWLDGNPNNEDRRGYSVSLINDKIKIAEEGDIVIGVVSGNPSVVGDDAPMKWIGKYLKDDFGSYIRNEEGYRVLNPEYNENAEYISREDRPEWSTIGLMGKLRLRKGQVVSPSWIKMKDISEQVEEWLVK